MAASTRCSGKAVLAYLMLVCVSALIATSSASAGNGNDQDATQGRGLQSLLLGKAKLFAGKGALLAPKRHIYPVHGGKYHGRMMLEAEETTQGRELQSLLLGKVHLAKAHIGKVFAKPVLAPKHPIYPVHGGKYHGRMMLDSE